MGHEPTSYAGRRAGRDRHAVRTCSRACRRAGRVIRTETGLVRGFTADGAEKFLGIPYAAPPVGARRWRPPAAAQPWTGVRDATHYGNRCPQLPSSNGAGSENEDCLYVNVFRPARLARRPAPVLVFIHGGGLVNGSGDQHDGALLARSNGIVVVSFNYRLGVFGFLALPALSAEAPDHASGDYGMLDQQAAIALGTPQHRRVRRRPAARDNKRRVGRRLVGLRPTGLAARCTDCSPGDHPEQQLRQQSLSRRRGRLRADRPGRRLPRSRDRGGVPAREVGARPAGGSRTTRSSFTTSGGSELPIAPADAISSGRFNHVPVINGTNHDEARTFSQDFADLDAAAVRAVRAG